MTMPQRRRASQMLGFVCSAVFFGASVSPVAASDDPFLFFLASPTVELGQGARGSITVDVVTFIEAGVPDGEPPVPGFVVDPKAMAVSYRRIDQTLRPWVQLSFHAAQQKASEAGKADYPFGAIPAVTGATYEIRVGVADAISWKAGAPTPPPSELGEVTERMREGACFVSNTPAEIVANAHQTLKVVTIPSQGVATPDVALKAAQRAFVGHSARVLRNGASALLDFSSPHACAAPAALTLGQQYEVVGLGRVDAGSLGTTSVGPSGIPASALLPAHVERSAPGAVFVSLAPTVKMQADSITLTFASTDELRQYLMP